MDGTDEAQQGLSACHAEGTLVRVQSATVTTEGWAGGRKAIRARGA